MSEQEGATTDFQHGDDFAAGEVTGGLALGPLEMQYEELFSEALEDGVITAEERSRLEKAADNLGIDGRRLLALERAMVGAYESRHKVKIIEHYEEPRPSLAPINVEAAGDAGRQVLIKRIEQLEARVRELEAELLQAQANMNVEVDLSDIESAAEDASEDPEECWRRIRRDPTKVENHRALYRVYEAKGQLDKQWCVSQTLVALGHAKPAEAELFEKHRQHGLIAPRMAVSQNAWSDYLFHPEEEMLTGQIFAIIAPGVLIGRVTTLRRDKQLHQPAADTKQDPDTATVTAVRALVWASRALGLAVPPVYVEKDRDVGFEHIPAVPPLTVVGKGVLSGRSQHEVAFLAGRHLTGYRQEHYVKTLFSGVQDLEDLFLAALTIGSPGLPIAEDMKQRVSPIASAIAPMLEPAQVDALRGYFLRFVEEGGRTNLQRWASATEKTACRVGMVLGSDLNAALGVLEAEEGKLGELGKDLLCFVTSPSYFSLRKQLGIAVDQN